MRTSIMLASALAATAFAKPLAKRDVIVTQVDVVYTTDVVTVTAGQAAPSSASAVHKHHHHHSSSSSTASSSSVVAAAPAPSSTTQAPVPVQPASSSYAPAPAPATSAASSSAPEVTGTYGGTSTATTYQQAVVNHHNYHRQNHSSPAISWDQEMADVAMSIAQTCIYGHNMTASSTPYGQNIAAGVGASDIGSVISDMFYNGEVNRFTFYGQAQPDMTTFEGWGHFSQVVWAGSTGVGCATWNCNGNLQNFGGQSNAYFTVCNYSPPGNYAGEYGANIGNSLGQPTIDGSYNVDTSAIGQSYCSATGQTLN